MTKRRALNAEMSALKSTLAAPRSAPSAEPDRPARADAADEEDKRMMGELRENLDELAAAAEEQIAAHPLPSIAAAFLLGVALGRLSRGI